MSRPRLLDLFSGAGGAAFGYMQAGFDVTGIDIAPQPNYIGDRFVQADALQPPVRLEDFDLIHASPPCQGYSRAMLHLTTREHPQLIDPTRALLLASGVPYIIENVEGAPLPTQPDLFGRQGIMLCGTMFDLRVRRHRLFEASFSLATPAPCAHPRWTLNPYREDSRQRMYAEFGKRSSMKIFGEHLGIEWMRDKEMSEAIPPAYTKFIGEQFLAQVRA